MAKRHLGSTLGIYRILGIIRYLYMLNVRQWSMEWGGRTLTVQTGKLALQATASCTVQYGDTLVLATVVKSSSTRDIDYFPLMTSFEEKLYAAGKIKGSRFMKREGRPSDESVLIGRLIDRALRPLFDDRIRDDIQVIVTPLSVDQENDAGIVGLIAASCVLHISSIPWNGPIGAARIGRKDGSLILNATREQIQTSDLDLVVAGTPTHLAMVEAGAKEVNEQDMYQSITWGLSELEPVISFIKKIGTEFGTKKETIEDIVASYNTKEEQLNVKSVVESFVHSVRDTHIFNAPKHTRKERKGMLDTIKKDAEAHLAAQGIAPELWGYGLKFIKEFVSNEISKRILETGQRLDGRSLTDIRPLHVEVDLLPRVHGSGLFMRGDTQVLSVVTLGAPGDVQTLDSMEEDGTKRYMHHYNDAPFTYGEVEPIRGPSRRAIGHGALAERALEPVLPPQEQFPYAIRVVSEVLGSNGSSSMASTCGSTLSLMAAGVPITKPVAGIAMGLASNTQGQWKILTDLQDVEDGMGGMDFKIAGTKDGITAMQMDTKTSGLSLDIVKQTIDQAFQARTTILATMNVVISEARKELSPYAPRIETILIDPEKIRDVIGPGGKTINAIIDATGVTIDIEQDGRVMITSSNGEGMQKAIQMVKDLTREVQAGEIFTGKVVRLEDFGAFINLLPGKDGLVHVSEISWGRTNKPGDVLNIGDEVQVKVKEIDNLGRVNLSMKALLPKPEGYVDQPPRTDKPFGGPKKDGGGYRGGPRRDQGGRPPRRDYQDQKPMMTPPAAAPTMPSPTTQAMPDTDTPKKKGFFERLKGE
jgi:polyribonucleotide nucleotidyltransferase